MLFLPVPATNIESLIWHHSPDYQLATWLQILDHFHYGKGSIFVLTGLDTYFGCEFSFLHGILPKLPSIDLQNSLSTIRIIYTALLLIKKLTLQQSGSMWYLWNSLVLPCSLLSRSSWWNGRRAFWRLNYSANLVAIPWKTGQRFPRRLHLLWNSIQYMALFSHCEDSWVQESRSRNVSFTIHYYF